MGSTLEDNTKKLYEAAWNGCVSTLDTLTQQDPLILYKLSLTCYTETPLHISACLGHLDFTIAVLIHMPNMAAQLDSSNCSPLHLASAQGHTDIVKALLNVNTDVCMVRDHYGRIPLHLAATRGRLHVIQQLISACPDSSTQIVQDGGGDTALHLCVKYNHLEALKLLVNCMKLNGEDLLNLRDQDGNTILHIAASLKQLETVKSLLSVHGVRENANALNRVGFTSLDVLELCPRDFKTFQIRDVLIEAGVSRAKNQNHNVASTEAQATPPTTIVSREAQPQPAVNSSRFSKWMECLKYQGNFVQDMHGSLMVVATVIATITFQAGINPPGGVWQQTYTNSSSDVDLPKCSQKNRCIAGTAVLASVWELDYLVFVIFNTIAFMCSLGVVLLLISGFPLKNKVCIGVLTAAMCTTVSFLALTYLRGVTLVSSFAILGYLKRTYIVILVTWIGLLFLVGLVVIFRLCYWLKKKLREKEELAINI